MTERVLEKSSESFSGLQVRRMSLPGVRLIVGKRHEDARGWFAESWRRDMWQKVGIESDFIQDNLVMNRLKGTLRGLHWQREPYAQAKLVRCLTGALIDVVADVRPESPTFGRWEAVPLSAEGGEALFVPAGYAHGYVTTADSTLVLYKVDVLWQPSAEASCRWNDPTLGIDWGVTDPILSDKDRAAPLLRF